LGVERKARKVGKFKQAESSVYGVWRWNSTNATTVLNLRRQAKPGREGQFGWVP
jgi:hypothetical protein